MRIVMLIKCLGLYVRARVLLFLLLKNELLRRMRDGQPLKQALAETFRENTEMEEYFDYNLDNLRAIASDLPAGWTSIYNLADLFSENGVVIDWRDDEAVETLLCWSPPEMEVDFTTYNVRRRMRENA